MTKKKQLDIDDYLNPETGEITPKEELNVPTEKRTVRKNGSLRIQRFFHNCPSMAEQHTAHLTDINYLMEKHRPDEVAAFIAARSQRPEIQGHDFSTEPSMQEARNIAYNARKLYFELSPNVREQFPSVMEFIKFMDNPANADTMVRLGLIEPKKVEDLKNIPKEIADKKEEVPRTT